VRTGTRLYKEKENPATSWQSKGTCILYNLEGAELSSGK
jgi:hypothetical protein